MLLHLRLILQLTLAQSTVQKLKTQLESILMVPVNALLLLSFTQYMVYVKVTVLQLETMTQLRALVQLAAFVNFLSTLIKQPLTAL